MPRQECFNNIDGKIFVFGEKSAIDKDVGLWYYSYSSEEDMITIGEKIKLLYTGKCGSTEHVINGKPVITMEFIRLDMKKPFTLLFCDGVEKGCRVEYVKDVFGTYDSMLKHFDILWELTPEGAWAVDKETYEAQGCGAKPHDPWENARKRTTDVNDEMARV